MEVDKVDNVKLVKKCYEILELIEKPIKIRNGEQSNSANTIENLNEYVLEFMSNVENIKEDDELYLFNDEQILDEKFPVKQDYPGSPRRVPINGETVLFRAVAKYKGHKKKSSTKLSSNQITTTADDQDECRLKIIRFIIDEIPYLITFAKLTKMGDKCRGYSPFFLAIVKKHVDLVKHMIAKMPKVDLAKEPTAKGHTFGNSVMLAGTPLGVAALTMNQTIFRKVLMLYKNHPPMLDNKEKGDNIIHSMIKYAHKNQDQLVEVKEMLKYILNIDTWTRISDRPEDIVRNLIRSKSKEHLSPLQLAAKRQQFDIFHTIMQNENYRWCNSDDGLSAHEEYDITEIETIPLEEEKIKKSSDEEVQKVKHLSVLEFISLQHMSVAFKFVDYAPIREIIKRKWSNYRYLFYAWFVFHLVVMSILTWGAVRRSSLQFKLVNTTERNGDFKPVPDDPTSLGISIFGLCVGLLTLVPVVRYFVFWCIYGRFIARVKSNFLLNIWRTMSSIPYSNKIFGIYFVVFALLLVVDFPLAIEVDGYDNYCLVFAILIGWYLVLFFLQPIRRFSFFTVLIQQVIKDMINFAIIMGFLLLGFTVAMFMVMQGSSSNDDDFSNLPKTLLKMFTVMLGIGELGDIYNARQPVLASFIFVLFVLLTTILLLNALIAMMSNSCTDLVKAEYGGLKTNKLHETLQKLSVIIFLEASVLPERFQIGAGEVGSDESRRTMKKSIKFYSEIEMETIDEGNPNFFHKIIETLSRKKIKKKRNKFRKGGTTDRNSAVAPEATGATQPAICELYSHPSTSQ